MTTVLDHPDLPPIPLPPGLLHPLDELLHCLCTGVAESAGGPVCFCGLIPGVGATWDHCSPCEGDHGPCGMAWVRVVSVFPYTDFPVPIIDLRCTNPLAIQVEIGILRCMPVEAQDATESTETAVIALDDAFTMWRALQCCGSDGDWAIGIYTPLGPLGGCVGGSWSAWRPVN